MTEENLQPTPHAETPEQQPAPEQPIPFDDAVKAALHSRGVKPKCLTCNSIGWLNMNVGVVAWPALQGMAQIALLICKKCAHIEPFEMASLGLSLNPPEQSRVITPDQIRQEQKSLVIQP